MTGYRQNLRNVEDAAYLAGPGFSVVEAASGLAVERDGRTIYRIDPHGTENVGALAEMLESQRSTGEWRPSAENRYGMEFHPDY